MLPGLLSHMRRNGVSELLESNTQDTRIKDLIGAYRRKFYREPMGAEAFDSCLMEEAMYISTETIRKAESFHQEYCVNCYDRKTIKLSNDGYNYFFICENKCC